MPKSCVSALFVLFQSKQLNLPKSYVSALFVLFQSKWLNLPKILVSVKFVYFYAKIICFSTFCIIPVQTVKSAKNPCFKSNLYIFMLKLYISALFRQFHYIIFFLTDTNVHSLAT